MTNKYFPCFLTLIFLFFSCKQEEDNSNIAAEEQDLLESTNILGDWKLQSRSFNGITSLAIECCEYLEFRSDSILSDYSGNFFAHGTGYQTTGTFEINPDSSLLSFYFSNNHLIYYFEAEDSSLLLRYNDDNQDVVENWVKE